MRVPHRLRARAPAGLAGPASRWQSAAEPRGARTPPAPCCSGNRRSSRSRIAWASGFVPGRATTYATRRFSGLILPAPSPRPRLPRAAAAAQPRPPPQLDPKAADLDLAVLPSETLEHPVGSPSSEIARPIQPPAWSAGEAVRHETLRRQLRPVGWPRATPTPPTQISPTVPIGASPPCASRMCI